MPPKGLDRATLDQEVLAERITELERALRETVGAFSEGLGVIYKQFVGTPVTPLALLRAMRMQSIAYYIAASRLHQREGEEAALALLAALDPAMGADGWRRKIESDLD